MPPSSPFFRTVMGAKGSKVQTVTRDFDVQIKFPDKAGENGEPPAAPRPDRSSNPNIIRITGTCHQSCEKKKSAYYGTL